MTVILKLMLTHMYLCTYLFGCIQLSTVVTYRHLEGEAASILCTSLWG